MVLGHVHIGDYAIIGDITEYPLQGGVMVEMSDMVIKIREIKDEIYNEIGDTKV